VCPEVFSENTDGTNTMTPDRNDLGKMLKQEVATAKHDEVVKLKETGLSYAEIGRRLGISRERARQLAKGKLRQKPDLQSKVMLRTGEVAHLLGLHVNTVRHWSQKGILKSHRIGPRGDRRFSREDIDGFLKQGCERYEE